MNENQIIKAIENLDIVFKNKDKDSNTYNKTMFIITSLGFRYYKFLLDRYLYRMKLKDIAIKHNDTHENIRYLSKIWRDRIRSTINDIERYNIAI